MWSHSALSNHTQLKKPKLNVKISMRGNQTADKKNKRAELWSVALFFPAY